MCAEVCTVGLSSAFLALSRCARRNVPEQRCLQFMPRPDHDQTVCAQGDEAVCLRLVAVFVVLCEAVLPHHGTDRLPVTHQGCKQQRSGSTMRRSTCDWLHAVHFAGTGLAAMHLCLMSLSASVLPRCMSPSRLRSQMYTSPLNVPPAMSACNAPARPHGQREARQTDGHVAAWTNNSLVHDSSGSSNSSPGAQGGRHRT